ncbi:hypothetical protein CLV84_4272 [Neolewinella xylanilytica]|uniref:Uncharacterized protein n=1 Tax=Neolewinella xylanilytica TaxID=1514080 RepID=A0A2S6I021_9BACT|nr:hypothetical protein CLV84_4272 [Neolewinella xylanilytica]
MQPIRKCHWQSVNYPIDLAGLDVSTSCYEKLEEVTGELKRRSSSLVNGLT